MGGLVFRGGAKGRGCAFPEEFQEWKEAGERAGCDDGVYFYADPELECDEIPWSGVLVLS